MYRHALRRFTRPPLVFSPFRPASIRTRRNVARDEDLPGEETTKPRMRTLNEEPDPALFEDHRKPWFYTVRKISNFLVLPTVFLYAVFFYDWGHDNHVFMPARLWLDEQKAAFFSLSPEERALADSDEDTTATENSRQPGSATDTK